MDEKLREILDTIEEMKRDVLHADGAEALWDYYEPIYVQLKEAADAIRGAIALT